MTEQLPPPFIVGNVYEDHDGKYQVISFAGNRIVFQRDDGTPGDGDIEIKARIYRNILLKRNGPTLQPYRRDALSWGNHNSQYTYEQVTPLVAEIIEEHSVRRRDYITHEMLVDSLLNHRLMRSTIDNLPQTGKFKTPKVWAGVIIADFSKQWKLGGWAQFDRMEAKRGHAWALKSLGLSKTLSAKRKRR